MDLVRFGDEITDRVLQNLVNSSSETLEVLFMSSANLTRIPHHLSSFYRLHQLQIFCFAPTIKVIETGALNFSAPITKVEIQNCGIKEIQPGALLGNLEIMR